MYEEILLWTADVILWKQPLVFLSLFTIFNVTVIFARMVHFGFFATLFLLCEVFYIIAVLFKKFKKPIKSLLHLPSSNQAEHIETHESISKFIIWCRLFLRRANVYLIGGPFVGLAPRIGFIIAVWGTLTFVVNILGHFWLFLSIVDLILLTPGIAHVLTEKMEGKRGGA